MEQKEEAIRTRDQGEEAQSVNAERPGTDKLGEYFERYEKRNRGKESVEESGTEYWLSDEEEEENHQFRRRKWISHVKKEPHVVHSAKAPKLRPAEGTLTCKSSNRTLIRLPRRPKAVAMGPQP